MIIFLSCTKKKQTYTCTAAELYSASQWFRGGYRYAQKLKPDAIYILSAKYGLLKPDDIISPYEKTLISAKDAAVRKWSIMVANQIKAANIDRTQTAVFICGEPYRRYLQNLFPKHTAPCSHLGIGKQMQYFKEHT